MPVFCLPACIEKGDKGDKGVVELNDSPECAIIKEILKKTDRLGGQHEQTGLGKIDRKSVV